MQAVLWNATEQVAFTNSATVGSAAADVETHIVRISADADCFIVRESGKTGTPAAQTVGAPLRAGQVEYLQVQPKIDKIWVRGMTASGILYVTKCT